MAETPHYGTWVRPRRILLFWWGALLCAGIAAFAFVSPWLLLALLPAAVCGYIAAIITWAHWRLSPAGGDYQARIHELLLVAVEGGREFLDIGCGSGRLLIAAAKRHPSARCVGVDTWGEDWAYSLDQCRTNARLEEVANVEFHRGDAAKLAWEDGRFDRVVSCMTFHEVRGAADKVEVVREALRVLRPGGRFAFIDPFDDPSYYPMPSAITSAISAADCVLERSEKVPELLPLPYPLGMTKVLGHARLLVGTKQRVS